MSQRTVCVAPDPNRLTALDAARTLAAIGVVSAHVLDELYPGDPLKVLGTFAVPFYLFVALYFTARGLTRNADRSVRGYVLGRVWKLYVPFLLWNLTYDALHVAYHRGASFSPVDRQLWAANYTHLYFLPFLFVATLLLASVVRPVSRRPALRWGVAIALVMAGVVVGAGPQPTWLNVPSNVAWETLWNAYRAVPAACCALACALVLGARPQRLRTSSAVAVVGLCVTAACLLVQYHFAAHPLLRMLSGLGFAAAAFAAFDARWLRPIAWVGRLSFGVYLSHVAFIRVAMALAGDRADQPTWTLALAIGAFAFVGALLFSAALARSRYTRWIIGCEDANDRKRHAAARSPLAAATSAAAPSSARAVEPTIHALSSPITLDPCAAIDPTTRRSA